MERTEITRVLLSFIHSLFCKKQHPAECTFYNDIELADCWDLPDVVCWTALTMLLMERMHTDEKGLLDSIAKVHRYLEGLNNLTKAEQKLFTAVLMGADLRYAILEVPASCQVQTLIDSVSGLASSEQVCQ